MNIDLHAPTMPIFLVSLVLAVLALLGYFVVIPYITLYGFWSKRPAQLVARRVSELQRRSKSHCGQAYQRNAYGAPCGVSYVSWLMLT